MNLPVRCPSPMGCTGAQHQFEEAAKSDQSTGFRNYQELKIQDNAS
jgi:hypothetical protein